MRPEPWLYFNSTELANNMRTSAYLRTLGPTGWSITDGCNCEEYNETFVDPATDDAPWYVATDPASEEFLGVLVGNIEISSPIGRNVAPNGSFGSVVGGLRMRGRGVTLTGALTASTPRGMAFGKRWLSALLIDQQGNCATCGLSDLCILPYCPDGDVDPDLAYRTLYRVGAIDGPVWGSQETIAECYLTPFTVTFASELPHLHGDVNGCVTEAQLTSGRQRCCEVTVPDWPNDVAFRVELTAGSPDPITNIRIALTPRSEPSLSGECETVSDEAVLMLRASSYADDDGTDWFNDASNSIAPFVATGGPRHLPESEYGQYAYFPGVGATANNLSTPDDVIFTPATGTFVVEAMIQPESWYPAANQAIISKWNTAGQRSWRLSLATTGRLVFEYSNDGTTINTLTAPLPTPTGTGDQPVWIRILFGYDNLTYAACHFYYKFSEDATWEYLGYALGSVYTIFDSTATVNIGRSQVLDLLEFIGKIWYVRVEIGAAGGSTSVDVEYPLVAQFDAREMVAPYTSYTDSGGRVWTLGQTTADLPNVIVDRASWLLDGANDYFESPDDALLDFGATDSFTIIALARVTSTAAAKTLIAKRAAATGTGAGYNLSLDNAANAFIAIGDGAASSSDSQAGILVGETQTIVGIRNVTDDELTAIIDGTGAAPTTDTTTATLANANVVRVGRLTGAGAEYFHGQLYAVGVWSRVLTADEIELATQFLLGEDPTRGGTDACSEIIVRELQPGTRLEVDGARRTVQVIEESSGRVIGGLDVLELEPGVPFAWPVAGHCVTACMCVSAYGGTVNPNTYVTTYSIVRDL